MPVTLPEWIEGVVFIEEDGAKRILSEPELPRQTAQLSTDAVPQNEFTGRVAVLRNRQSREVGKLAAERLDLQQLQLWHHEAMPDINPR